MGLKSAMRFSFFCVCASLFISLEPLLILEQENGGGWAVSSGDGKKGGRRE